MKKLIIFMLLLAVGVGEMLAENKTIRFVVGSEMGWGKINIHIWSSKGDVTTWPGQAMTWFSDCNGKKWFHAFVDIPEEKLSTLQWKFDNGDNTENQSNESEQTDLSGNNDERISYIWNNGITTEQSLKYYLYNITSATFIELSKNGQTYSGTIDVSISNNTRYLIFPSYSTNNNGVVSVNTDRWDLVYRPNSNSGDYAINSWRIWNDNTKFGGSDAFMFTQLEDVTYDFSFNAQTSSWTLIPHFTREVKSIGYATFSSPYAVAIPDGVTASYATGITDKTIDFKNFTNGIPANTGALLQATPGTYTFTPASTTDEITTTNQDNVWLMPNTSATTLTQDISGYTKYILTNRVVGQTEDATTGFYKVKTEGGNNAAKGTAYLKVKDGYPSAGAPEFFSFFNDLSTPTGISKIEGNNQLENKTVFNLNGQRVMNPTKGLYILNGRKVVLK